MNEDKFTGKAEVYSSHRPGYPPELYTCLFSEAGLKAEDAIADIGAGTGIFSKPLLDKGCAVFAVEPNPDMRKIAVRDLGSVRNYILSYKMSIVEVFEEGKYSKY